jgi:hypothetical protein
VNEVAGRLLETAAVFAGTERSADVALVYAPLVARVQAAPAAELAAAVELVYEGYLAHYRSSRVLPAAAGVQVRLLAGDYFYAHGLHAIAASGDIGAVGLLTRLMGACSALRVEGVDTAVDDGLWEMTVAAVAAGESSPARAAAAGAFDLVEAAGRAADWPAAAAAAADGRVAVGQALPGAAAPAQGA